MHRPVPAPQQPSSDFIKRVRMRVVNSLSTSTISAATPRTKTQQMVYLAVATFSMAISLAKSATAAYQANGAARCLMTRFSSHFAVQRRAFQNRGLRGGGGGVGDLSVMATEEYDYDFIVIGGGSGGMAASKEAAKAGAKVALFDFVKPSTQGSTWGLGGTCVNVGCVPKKLMHYASLMSPILHQDAKAFGWQVPDHVEHNWSQLVQTVQNHVKSLNFGYRNGLRSAKVNYINALAKFTGPRQITYTLKGEEKVITGKYILIAVGGRPHIPSDIPGAKEIAITSDDIFALKRSPGKSLVVGASYIALECAGFLTKLGFPTTVAVRSILLRGFDRQCSEKVGQMMVAYGTKFYQGSLPTSLVRQPNGKILVTFSGGRDPEEFDTVLYATGREPDTKGLGLEAAGVATESDGKLKTTHEQTNVPHIFAVGDVLQGKNELTPVAIKAGEILARRLFGGSSETMDWDLIPTTVFTPAEYGAVGLSEEDAVARYGADNLEIYLFEFTTLEVAAAHRHKHPNAVTDPMDEDMPPNSFAKLVCVKSEDERVVGFHFVGSNAGEMTQGFALALRLGAKKADFDRCIGIHPTDVEAFMSLSVTKRSGESWVASGGCGGGKCG